MSLKGLVEKGISDNLCLEIQKCFSVALLSIGTQGGYHTKNRFMVTLFLDQLRVQIRRISLIYYFC